jgi:hypothetical protein
MRPAVQISHEFGFIAEKISRRFQAEPGAAGFAMPVQTMRFKTRCANYRGGRV